MAAPAPAPPARSRNARGEGEKLRDQLVEATVALLDTEGDAERVSVRAIARTAGVSPTALYLHFSDRESLVAAAVDHGFATFNAALLSAAATADTPRERIRRMGLAYLEFAIRQPALYTVLFSARRNVDCPPDRTAAVDRDEALDGLGATVAEALDADADEAREIALLLWAALHGYATLRVARPVHDWPAAERFVTRLGRALLRP